MTETLALAKFSCPSCGGEAVWNPGKQKLVCPFCGTESPAKLDPHGAIVEHDLVVALRGVGDAARGWQADSRQVKCQSCNAISVLEPARQAQHCEFCGSTQLVPYEEAKPAFRPESVLPFRVRRIRRARRDPRLVRQAVARAVRAQAPRAHRHRPRRLPSVLDLRCARRCRVDGRGRPLLLHDGNLRRERPDADAAGAARALGTRGRTAVAFLRRRSRLRIDRRPSRAPARHRAVPDAGPPSVRRRLRRGLGRRALPDRPRRRGAAGARRDGGEAAGALCAAGAGRHLPQPRGAVDVFGTDVQAHPRAGVAAHATPTARARSSA